MKKIFDKKFMRYFLVLAIPVVLQQLLVNLLQICDTMMISGVSEKAISGVSVANKFFFIYNLALFGLTNGIGVFISQYSGARNIEGCNQVFRFGLKLCITVALCATIFLLIAPEITISLFVKSPKVIEYGMEYVNIVRFSYIPFAVSMMCSVAFKVKGNTLLPMKVGSIAFVVNIVFNYLLIYGHFFFPKWGVSGAAVATLLSRVIEMILLIYAINKSEDLNLFIKFKPLKKAHKIEVIRKALPLVCNEVVWSLALSAIFLNYCVVDEYFIPALTVVDNVSSMMYVVFAGCATATGVIIGNTLGANDFKQAKLESKRMIIIGCLICVSCSLLIFVVARFVPGMFSLHGKMAYMSVILLMIKCGFTWTQGYAETIYYILRAGGDTKGVFIIDGLFTCLGPLLLSTLCARVFHTDLIVMFALVEGVNLFKVLISTYYYRKEKWLNNLAYEEKEGKLDNQRF